MLVLSALVCTALAAAPAPPTITLSVDAREATRRVLHAHLSIPAAEGPLVLRFPKWNPGTHAPSTPLNDLVGLHVSATGKPVAWQRDPIDLYAFHLQVPPGARTVEVALDHVMTPPGYLNEGAQATSSLLMLNFWPLLLVPDGPEAQWAVRVKLPAGYRWASALTKTQEAQGELQFAPVPLATLIDSPLLAGSHFRTVSLSKGERPVELHLAGDSEGAVALPPEGEKALSKLVTEADALFGARHFRRYQFLVSLTDNFPDFGLEHHEASDDRVGERAFIDEEVRPGFATLLPHEFTHSWNGKYRRPLGLAPATPQGPMVGTLLWVYEGLTEYLGTFVLSGRSGLLSPEEVRETIAAYAAGQEVTSGRSWRPLADTAASAPILYGASTQWALERRGVDFYAEGALLWLEVDAKLRTLSGGKRSLDDFCRAFFGGASGAPQVVTYQLEDVLAGLEAVAPFDWKGFFAARVDDVTAHPPRGPEASGWKVVYDDKPNAMLKSWEAIYKIQDASLTLGLQVHEDGTLADVVGDSPAARAGLAPGLKLIGVNGRKYTPQVLTEAIAATRTAPKPMQLLVEDGDFFRTATFEYKSGLRSPHLERVPGTADLLGDILAPKSH
jgi:predicted metalloprotease with PDZ domain